MESYPQEAVLDRPVFTGSVIGFWGLALVNLLLTVITLGIYRFWAKTRVRQHLWGNTVYAGSAFEYTGRGVELLVGALLAFAVLIVPATLVSIGGLVVSGLGLDGLQFVINAIFYAAILWLLGFAVYRALRYRLSRTRWRGIRGGMVANGTAYAWLDVKMRLLQLVTLGFASPYAATRRWNAQWSDAMFGDLAVTADAEWRPVMRRFILSWIAAGVVAIAAFATFFVWNFDLLANAGPNPIFRGPDAMQVYGSGILIFLVAAIAVTLILVSYTAALTRALFAGTRLDTLQFRFGARTADWLGYYLGIGLLLLVTFGIGIIFLPHRYWTFMVRHISTIGTLDFDRLAQTSLTAPQEGEGLADAFDIAPF